MKLDSPRIYSWLLALLLPIFAVYPALFMPIEEHAYDAAVFHIYRGVVFSDARADGWFYPRWVQSINGGLGGPLFQFYSPLSYFLMDLASQLGVTMPQAWRILVALALLAATLGMFGLGLSLFRRADVALLGAGVFVYNSYLLRDLFERGSPQGFAVALLPLLIWLLDRSARQPSGARVTLASICFAAMILLHNATALLLLPVLVIFVVYLFLRERRRALAALAGLGAGICLDAFYLIPYVFELQYVQFDNPLTAGYALPAANPLRLEDFLSLPRVFDVGIGNNAMAESGGLFHALVLLLAIPVVYGLDRGKGWGDSTFVVCNFMLVFFVIWMQLESAALVWNAFPALNVLQFRWRLLSVMGFVSAIILGYFFVKLESRWRGWLVSIVLIGYCVLALPSLYPNLLFRYVQFPQRPTIADVQEFALESAAVGLTSFDEYLPRWRQAPITGYVQSPIANLPGDATLVDMSRRAGYLRVDIKATTHFTAAFNVLYYPGWSADLDGERLSITATPQEGLIELGIPAGAHTIELRREGTPAQRGGDWASIVTLIGLGLIAFIWRARSNSTTQLPIHEFLAPRWQIPIVLLALAALKWFWIDPHTTIFRAASTCGEIQDRVAQTNVVFQEQIRLCGYSLAHSNYQPSDVLRITLYWQLEALSNQPAYGFVHLLGQQFNPETGNPLWGQQDKETPAEHVLTSWAPRKLYRDVYTFRIASGTPKGEYELEIGWQDAKGTRLKPIIVSGRGNLSVSHLDALILSGVRIH